MKRKNVLQGKPMNEGIEEPRKGVKDLIEQQEVMVVDERLYQDAVVKIKHLEKINHIYKKALEKINDHCTLPGDLYDVKYPGPSSGTYTPEAESNRALAKAKEIESGE